MFQGGARELDGVDELKDGACVRNCVGTILKDGARERLGVDLLSGTCVLICADRFVGTCVRLDEDELKDGDRVRSCVDLLVGTCVRLGVDLLSGTCVLVCADLLVGTCVRHGVDDLKDGERVRSCVDLLWIAGVRRLVGFLIHPPATPGQRGDVRSSPPHWYRCLPMWEVMIF